jgi:Mrp family chromosome partitioning ATPase
MGAIGDTRGAKAPGYRQAVLRLLNHIMAKATPGKPAIVMLVSPSANSGASATALAVAYAGALTGERVLLVDAASTNAALSAIFASQFIEDSVVMLDNKDHLARITTRDAQSGLVFLPIALADLRILKSNQRRRLVTGLTGLAQSYDLVVIDGGAVLEDESGASLMPAADQIILVARARSTSRQALTDAMRLIEQSGSRVEGLVLNMAGSELV